MVADLCRLSAVDLTRRIRTGELSPVGVIEAHLDRIHERDEELNAFVTVLDDHAREAAREAERALQRDEELGVLHGVPVAIKDMWGLKAGVRHTFGSKLFEDFVPDETATFVERLEAEGAIVIGKTNTPEFALGAITDNRVAGRTRNPFDAGKTAGGSSGGSAAAVAAGMVPLAQGSDMGGSVRIPASFCGVYGMKPTFGRIPIVEQVRPDAFVHGTPYAHIGPLTRSVRDAALMLDVMAGPHPKDPHALPDDGADYLAATDRSMADFDIAYSPDFGGFPVSADVRGAVDDAADALARTGASVDRIDLDMGRSQDEILDTFYQWLIVTWRTFLRNMATRYGVDPFGDDRTKLRTTVVETILEPDSEISAADFMKSNLVRTDVFDSLQEVCQEYDVLITPTVGVTTFDFDDPPTEVDGTEIEPLRGWILTPPCNMSGQPAASVPAGVTDAGLPVGLQVIGEKFDDEAVLAASAALERQAPWEESYPDL